MVKKLHVKTKMKDQDDELAVNLEEDVILEGEENNKTKKSSKTISEINGDGDPFILSGILNWPFLGKADSNGKYRTDLLISDKNILKQLKAVGVTIKNKDKELEEKGKDKQGYFVTLQSQYKPTVIDAKKKELPANIVVGNGTEAKVKTSVYEWTFKKKTGISLNLTAVQILNLVEFKGTNLDGFDEEEGFEAETNEMEDSGSEDEAF